MSDLWNLKELAKPFYISKIQERREKMLAGNGPLWRWCKDCLWIMDVRRSWQHPGSNGHTAIKQGFTKVTIQLYMLYPIIRKMPRLAHHTHSGTWFDRRRRKSYQNSGQILTRSRKCLIFLFYNRSYIAAAFSIVHICIIYICRDCATMKRHKKKYGQRRRSPKKKGFVPRRPKKHADTAYLITRG